MIEPVTDDQLVAGESELAEIWEQTRECLDVHGRNRAVATVAVGLKAIPTEHLRFLAATAIVRPVFARTQETDHEREALSFLAAAQDAYQDAVTAGRTNAMMPTIMMRVAMAQVHATLTTSTGLGTVADTIAILE